MPILANVIQDAFSPLITVFESIMVWIHETIGGSWGLAIIGLTVLIRAILVPLTFRQLKSMQEMQRLAPEINALKEKYKEDKQRQQQELMKFYQEKKINPLASCLPLLLQLPVFFSLFYMLRTDLKQDICGTQMIEHYSRELHKPTLTKFSEIPQHAVTVAGHTVKGLTETGCQVVAPGSAKFLFIPDITEKATGIALIILILCYVGSQVGSTLVATATADPMQRRLMLFLPVIFVVILYRYPAGLLVYWITTNVWTIGQQTVIRRRMPPPPKPPPGANGKPAKSLRESLSEAVASASSAKAAGSAKAAAPAAAPAGGAPPPPPRKKKKRSGRRR